MADVLSFANELRRVVILTGVKGSSRILPCFETSVTIPAITCLDGKLPDNVKLEPRVGIELRVSCYSWADAEVYEKLRELFRAPHYVAGTDDLGLRLTKADSLSEYVEKLWTFREFTEGKVYRTRTTFALAQRPHKVNHLQISETKKKRINIDHSVERLVILGKVNPTVYRMFVEVYAKINEFLGDFQNRSAVQNLLPFATKLRDKVLDPNSDLDINRTEDVETLGRALEMLLFGLQQRSVGIEVGISTPCGGTPYVEGAGGIQRVLLALSSIPTAMMRQLKKPWSGFTIVGWAGSYHRYWGGVVNMPTETAYHPELWSGVFHEVGHEYCSQLDILGNQQIVQSLERQRLSFEASTLQVPEIYSEIFACVVGYNNDFEQCLKTTWTYLASLPDFKEKLPDFFLRFLLTHVFVSETLDKSYLSTPSQFYTVAKKLCKDLENLGQVQALTDSQLRRISESAQELRVILDIIRGLIPKQSASTVLNDYPRLTDGRIPIDISSPVSLVRNIAMHGTTLPFKYRIAAILALWSYQVRTSRD